MRNTENDGYFGSPLQFVQAGQQKEGRSSVICVDFQRARAMRANKKPNQEGGAEIIPFDLLRYYNSPSQKRPKWRPSGWGRNKK